MFDCQKDGIDHINVYSKGKTALGRFLSNFAQVDLETKNGNFSSVEAYWYWLTCPAFVDPRCYECDGAGVVAVGQGNQTDFGPCTICNRDSLRELFGVEAKNRGRAIHKNRQCTNKDGDTDNDPSFQEKIKSAISFKIENNPQYKLELAKSTLPLVHYYVMYGKVRLVENHKWVIEYIEKLREQYKEYYGKMSLM